MSRKKASLHITKWAAILFWALPQLCVSEVVDSSSLVHCEWFGNTSLPPLLILLHGVNGPSPFYRGQAQFFADHGFRVVLPHYLQAGNGSAASEENYGLWIDAVRGVMKEATTSRRSRAPSIVLVGYSLGASIALALGSQGQGPGAIAEFSGSLPDSYFRDLKEVPPLLILHGRLDEQIPVSNALQLKRLCSDADLNCDMHIYPADGHAFSSDTLRDADQRILAVYLERDRDRL